MLQMDCIESILLDVKDWTILPVAKSKVKGQGLVGLRTWLLREMADGENRTRS